MDDSEKKLKSEYEKRLKRIFDENDKELKKFKKKLDSKPVNVDGIVEKWS